MISSLDQLLLDRLAELLLFAKEHKVIACPHTYPAGLFRQFSFDFPAYVQEVEEDCRQLRLTKSLAAQEYLAKRILQKIDVLVLSAKNQPSKETAQTLCFLEPPTYQEQVDALRREIFLGKCTVEKLLRIINYKTQSQNSADSIQRLEDFISQQSQLLKVLEDKLKKLQSLPMWQRGF